METLKAEYLAQHRLKSESDLDDDDSPIDVVGDDSDDEQDNNSSIRDSIDDMPDSSDNVTTTTAITSPITKNTIRANPFSIESLLYSHT